MRMKLLAVMACAGCGVAGTPADLPLIVPPVRASAPAAFTMPSARTVAPLDAGLSPGDFRDRFFNPAGGPTDVFRILGDIDARLEEVNSASLDGSHACLDAPPIDVALAPFGESVAFETQCYRMFDDGMSKVPAFMQFGSQGDATYMFVTGGATRVAARVVQPAGAEPVVDVWYGVGYTNASCGTDGTFDGCSYAVTRIHASPATSSFEMSVAGIGVGFCGIQIRSDGTSMFGRGSTDMGATCHDPAELCVSAANLDPTDGCTELETFSIPALGRRAGAGAHEFGASAYPDAPNVTLDGTSTDSLQFGPADGPSAGVAPF
jgi:hypothetical protein